MQIQWPQQVKSGIHGDEDSWTIKILNYLMNLLRLFIKKTKINISVIYLEASHRVWD